MRTSKPGISTSRVPTSPAQGRVVFTVPGDIYLFVDPACQDLSPLERIAPDALYWLSLDRNTAPAAQYVHLQHLSGLHILGADQSQLTDAGIPFLQGLTGLRRLFLDDLPLTGAGFEALAPLVRYRRYLSAQHALHGPRAPRHRAVASPTPS